ncbi:MAG: hypothetical protein ACKVZ0_08180 [Gemmatimonadales bacterium]
MTTLARTSWLIPVVAAIAGLGILALRSTGWARPSRWLALGLVGYAASLRLIDAGPFVRYQHYAPIETWLSRDPLAVGILALQGALVAAGWWRSRPAWPRLLSSWPAVAVVLGALFAIGVSAAPSADPGRFGAELLIAAAIQGLHLATALLVAISAPQASAETLGRGGVGWLERERPPGRIDPVILGVAAFAGIVPLVLAGVVYEFHPHVPDELVYLIHARYFAEGLLAMPVPEPTAAFDLDLMFVHRDRWFSPVPPGWPAMLAVGVRLGVPWLVNPVLNAVNVILMALLAEAVYDRRAARTAALLAALSPWHLFLAMSLLTHTFTLTAALGAAVAVAHFRRTRRLAPMVIAGVGIGIVSLIRPLEGLIVAAALGVWSLPVRPWRSLLPGLAVLVATTAGVAALTLPYNATLTGSSRVFPIMAYTDALYGPGTNAMGFGANRGLPWSLDPFPGHSPRDAVINSHLNLTAINVEMLGWAAGSLGLLAVFGLARRFHPSDRGLLAVIAVTVGAHALYWFAGGPDFGARYWYLAAPAALLLTGQAIRQLIHSRPHGAGRGRVLVGVGALALGSALVFLPWRAADKYLGYRGMRPGLRALAADHRMDGGLVLIRGRRHPDYASAAELNVVHPTARSPIVAWNRDPATRRAVLARYPDRPVWMVDGPTVTGAGYRLVAGPLTADSAARIP